VARLEARGLIEARPPAGYYVRRTHRGQAPEPASSAPKPRPTAVDVSSLVFEVLDETRDAGIVPLGSAFPSPGLFPLDALNRIAAAVARRQRSDASLSDLPPGNAELRHQIA
ncbi:UNVERIFIED_CONTAM: PLP-dependent aminotransferase family protein, partial [Salmonella enterica subsp. enterica serovar Weltevreden]